MPFKSPRQVLDSAPVLPVATYVTQLSYLSSGGQHASRSHTKQRLSGTSSCHRTAVRLGSPCKLESVWFNQQANQARLITSIVAHQAALPEIWFESSIFWRPLSAGQPSWQSSSLRPWTFTRYCISRGPIFEHRNEGTSPIALPADSPERKQKCAYIHRIDHGVPVKLAYPNDDHISCMSQPHRFECNCSTISTPRVTHASRTRHARV